MRGGLPVIDWLYFFLACLAIVCVSCVHGCRERWSCVRVTDCPVGTAPVYVDGECLCAVVRL
jgi:hypothetical protein